MAMVEWQAVYLCDRQKSCKNSAFCCQEYCSRTSDPDHAKNGAIKTPQEAAERFDEVVNDGKIFYFEREDPTDDVCNSEKDH